MIKLVVVTIILFNYGYSVQSPPPDSFLHARGYTQFALPQFPSILAHNDQNIMDLEIGDQVFVVTDRGAVLCYQVTMLKHFIVLSEHLYQEERNGVVLTDYQLFEQIYGGEHLYRLVLQTCPYKTYDRLFVVASRCELIPSVVEM